MHSIGLFIDWFLYALLALTIVLIGYKALDLCWPWAVGKPSLEQQLGASEASLQAGLLRLETGLSLLAVIGATAPFVGLMGTVLHIMAALRGMGTGAAGMALISGPIATALNATLVGMSSAIPAVAAHALLQRRLDVLETVQRSRQARASE